MGEIKTKLVNELLIVLRIDDKETLNEYIDVHPDLILDDLQNGELAKMCSIIDVIPDPYGEEEQC